MDKENARSGATSTPVMDDEVSPNKSSGPVVLILLLLAAATIRGEEEEEEGSPVGDRLLKFFFARTIATGEDGAE